MLGHVGFVLVLVAVIIVARLIADRLNVPYTIVLTLCGLIYAGLPGPTVALDPHLVMVVIIPPLLYTAARRSSLLAIRANWRPITSLSVVLVLLTALAVGGLASLVAPKLSFAAAAVLGAAVAPPDPVAALSIGRRAGLPPRMVALIGGEGLLNDATALTTWQIAVAATVSGGFSLTTAAGKFVLASVGGLAIGAAIGYVLRLGRHLLRDPLVANTVSLATPFLAYLAGEEAHVSGVLAVVIAGLMAGHDPPSGESGATRLQTTAVWQLVDFLLEGFVFLLIGQQIPVALRGLSNEPAGPTAAAILVTLAAVLLVRPLWLFLTQIVPGWFGWQFGDPAPTLNGREVTALTWAGTRGVITLAAIFAVPAKLADGRPFPDRDLLLLCAYLVVLVTLVGQGLTFAPLLRRLKLHSNAVEDAQVRNEARLAALTAAEEALPDIRADTGLSPQASVQLRTGLRQRAERIRAHMALLDEADGTDGWTPEIQTTVEAQHALIDAQREELVRWRDSGRLPDESLRKLQRELDHEERTLPSQ